MCASIALEVASRLMRGGCSTAAINQSAMVTMLSPGCRTPVPCQLGVGGDVENLYGESAREAGLEESHHAAIMSPAPAAVPR